MSIIALLPLLRRRLAVASLLLLCAAHPVAFAEEGGRARAKELKDQGHRAFDQGKFSLALARFRDAFDAFPSPKLRFNIGLTLARLGRNAEAIDELEAFLGSESDAPASARDSARREMKELEPTVGRLAIGCDVEGAAVNVDGRTVGATPLPHPIRVPPGAHLVAVRKEGFPPFRAEVTVAAGETAETRAQLAGKAVAMPADSSPQSRYHKWAILGVVAAGVLGVGGAALRIAAQVKYNDLASTCSPICAGDASSGARALEYSGSALLITAALIAVADVALWLLDKYSDTRTAWFVPARSGLVAGFQF